MGVDFVVKADQVEALPDFAIVYGESEVDGRRIAILTSLENAEVVSRVLARGQIPARVRVDTSQVIRHEAAVCS